MIRFFLTSLLLVFGTFATAQKAFIFNTLQKNGFVALSVGITEPLGSFARQGAYAQNGLALRGQSIGLSAGYRLAGPLGFMARFDQTTNAIDPNGLLATYKLEPGDNLTAATAPGRSGQWFSRSVMVGPYVTIPIGRISLDLRAMAGQVWASCPETCVSGTINNTETCIRVASQKATALTAGLGLTGRFRLTPTLAIHSSVDYSSATFGFLNVPVEHQSGDVIKKTAVSSQRTLNLLNISFGLTFQFKSRNSVF